MNLGGTTLYCAFRENSGMSPVEYLSRYRMEQARKILQNQASVKAAPFPAVFGSLYFQAVPPHYRRTPSDETVYTVRAGWNQNFLR